MSIKSYSDCSGYELLNYLHDTFRLEIKRDVLIGLTSAKKSLPSKYFYDEKGSKLFDEICRLPEYYPTRTELSILRLNAREIMANFHDGDLIELGSGANSKIRVLLEAARTAAFSSIRYVPVDVSRTALTDAVGELRGIYSELKVLGIVADFIHHIDVIPRGRPKLIIFFGSTIGNLDEEGSLSFLSSVRRIMKRDDRFLFGLDMIKPVEVLEAAYNDSRGITAEFNRNILSVINRELNATFMSSMFDHVAYFNSERERIEMHLRSRKNISVEIHDIDLTVRFKEGETIHTEICRKFSRESAEKMISEARLTVANWYSDQKEWFSLVEVIRSENDDPQQQL